MKRWIFRVAVFLLLGAIVNVAVAWGFGYMVVPTTREHFYAILDPQAENDQWVPCSSATSMRAIGVERIEMRTAFTYVTAESNRAPDALPYWIPSDTRAKWGTSVWRIDHAVGELGFLAHGWPALAVWCDADGQPLSQTRTSTRTKFASGLGFRPIWPGFAINTLFYAAILWLLFAAPFALRRRALIKRGLCPACAYPIGASEVCTECGKLIPLPLRERARVRAGTAS